MRGEPLAPTIATVRTSWPALLLVGGCGTPVEAVPEIGTSSGSTSATTGADETSTGVADDSDVESSSVGAVDESSSGELDRGTIVVRFAFVHGVLGSASSQATAHDEALDMEAYLLAHAGDFAAQYEREHPGLEVEIESTRLKLYTDVQDALLVPGLDEMSDGTGITTANRWREQLARKLDLAYPNQANLVVIGHSTGARAAMEVAAGVIDDAAPGSHDWGVDDRIAGVVSLHGMIDALGNPEYDFKWCPGCGDFGVVRAIELALLDRVTRLGEPIENTAIVAGIGCSGNLVHLQEGPQPFGIHGIHGRTLPIAWGLKATRPDVNVMVRWQPGRPSDISVATRLHRDES